MTAVVGARNFAIADAGVVFALLQARYYDGSKGEFLSEDPSHLAIGNPQQLKQLTGQDQQIYLADPQQLNSYSYARDNPINLSDPNGNVAFVPIVIGIVAAYNAIMTGIDYYSAAQADVLPTTRNNMSFQEKTDANLQVAYDYAQSKAAKVAATKFGMKEVSPLLGMLQALSDVYTKGPDTVRYLRSGAFSNDFKDYINWASNKVQMANSLSTVFNSASTMQSRASAVNSFNVASGASSNQSKLWVTPSGAVVNWNGAVVSGPTQK